MEKEKVDLVRAWKYYVKKANAKILYTEINAKEWYEVYLYNRDKKELIRVKWNWIALFEKGRYYVLEYSKEKNKLYYYDVEEKEWKFGKELQSWVNIAGVAEDLREMENWSYYKSVLWIKIDITPLNVSRAGFDGIIAALKDELWELWDMLSLTELKALAESVYKIWKKAWNRDWAYFEAMAKNLWWEAKELYEWIKYVINNVPTILGDLNMYQNTYLWSYLSTSLVLLVVWPSKILKVAKLWKVADKLKKWWKVLSKWMVKLLLKIRTIKLLMKAKVKRGLWKIFTWYERQVKKLNWWLQQYPRYNFAYAMEHGGYNRIYQDIAKAEKEGNAMKMWGRKESWGKIPEKSIEEIKKSIRSLESKIREHEEKIQALKNWSYEIDVSKIKWDPEKYKQWLLKHWEKEIETFRKEIEKKKKFLKDN